LQGDRAEAGTEGEGTAHAERDRAVLNRGDVVQLQRAAVDGGRTGEGIAAAENDVATDHKALRRSASIGEGQIVGQDQRAAHAAEKVGVVGGGNGAGIGLGADGAQADIGQIGPGGAEVQGGGTGGGDGHGARGTGIDAA